MSVGFSFISTVSNFKPEFKPAETTGSIAFAAPAETTGSIASSAPSSSSSSSGFCAVA